MLRALIFRTLIVNGGINALGLVNSILLSHWLGPVGRGEIAAAMLWPGLLVYLSSMGLIVSSMYFSSIPDSKPQIVFNNAIVMGLILSGIVLPLGLLALPYLLRSQSLHVISASQAYLLVIPLSLVTQFGLGILQGRMRLVELNWLRVIIPAGYLAGSVVLMALGRLNLIHILGLHLMLSLTALVSTMLVLARAGIRPGFQTDRRIAKEMLSYGTKVHVGQVSGLANVSLDQVLMAAWLPPAYLGLYVVAVSSAGISQLFSQAVQTVTMPAIAQASSDTKRGELLQDEFRRYWFFSLIIMLVMAVMLPVLIPIIFGAAFTPAIWPAEILLLASCFKGAEQVLGGGAGASGNPWLGSKASMIAVLVTVGLLYALLRKIGILGAAIATAAAYLAELIVVIHGLRRTHFISPLNLFGFHFKDLQLAWQSASLRKRGDPS
jgi:O-antigen/teichoic acid export membrane protein